MARRWQSFVGLASASYAHRLLDPFLQARSATGGVRRTCQVDPLLIAAFFFFIVLPLFNLAMDD